MFKPTQSCLGRIHIFKCALTFSLLQGLKRERRKEQMKFLFQNLIWQKNDWGPNRKICSIPPIRLASEESRSPPMVLLGGGVAGGTAAMPPAATGVPMLPAVLPAVLPPVLCGVTAGISRSPNPSNTWEEGGNGRTSEKHHRLQTCKSLI